MTKLQEIFDRVAAHLLTQNSKATDEAGRECMYRAPDGRKCAVGCLIDDKFYTADLESRTVSWPEVQDALELSMGCRMSQVTYKMLADLQRLHDGAPVERWARKLEVIANEHRLKWRVQQ